MIIHLTAGLIKKTLYKMSQYFLKPYEPFGGDINVKFDLSNYATKADLKKATEIYTCNLTVKLNLGKIKAEVNKTEKEKLKNVPVALNKLCNVVNNDKKTVYDKLVAKVNSIDTSG